jgi:ATP-dependent exoDNAse (exonuclease V) beta subunit
MKCSNDKSVVFDSESHTYTKGKNKLISVTTFISKFKNKFDSDFYSKKIALRDGKTQDEVLAEWNEKAKKSCDIGTAIHKIFEDYTNNNYSIIQGDLSFDFMDLQDDYLLDFNIKKEVALKFINDFFITERLTPIYSELIVYNYFLAGQIDLICKDKKENYYILDFKTNDKIEKYSYNKKMLLMFSEINDSSFYHYSLQLSIYKRMFTEREIKEMFLIHIKNDSYEFIECEDIFEKYSIGFDIIKE